MVTRSISAFLLYSSIFFLLLACQEGQGVSALNSQLVPQDRLHNAASDLEGKSILSVGTKSVTSGDLDAESYLFRWQVEPEEKSILVDEILVVRRIVLGSEIQLDAGDAIDITSVTLDGRDMSFFHEEGRLRILLPLEAQGETRLQFYFRYRVLEKNSGLKFIADDDKKVTQIWSHSEPENARTWFIGVDRPDDKAFYQIELDLPESWQVLSNGRKVVDEVTSGRRRVAWQMLSPMPTYLFSVLMGEFEVFEESWRGIPLSYWVLPDQPQALDVFKKTPPMLDFLSDKLIPYPFVKYSIGIAKGFGGAMEHTTATTFSHTLVENVDALDHTAEIVALHELAHHWFGDTVTCKNWDELWLNESFATFFQALYMGKHYGDGAYQEEVESFRKRYFQREPRNGSLGPVVNDKSAPGTKFNVISYEKGALVLNMLYQGLGEDLFYKSLQLYLRRHFMGNATTDDLIKAFEFESGRSLQHFFQQWVYRPGYPELRFEVDTEGAKTFLTVEQTQPKEIDNFSFSLPVLLLTDSGERKASYWVSEKNHRFDLGSGVRGVVVDPTNGILMRWELSQSSAFWRNVFENRLVNDLHRLRAAVALSGELNAIEWLILYQDTSLSEGLRAKAFEEYGRHPEADFSTVMTGLHQGPKIRTALMKVLGHWPDDARKLEIENTLIETLESDPIWTVAAESAHALAARKSARAFDALVAELHRSQRRGYLLYAVLESLGELGDKRAIPVLEPFISAQHFFVRGNAAMAIAYFVGEDSAKQVLLKVLTQVLDYPDFAEWGFFAPKQVLKGLAKMGGEDVKEKVVAFSANPNLPKGLKVIADDIIANWTKFTENSYGSSNPVGNRALGPSVGDADSQSKGVRKAGKGSVVSEHRQPSQGSSDHSLWGRDSLNLVDTMGPASTIHKHPGFHR
jgi:aminopeptidase N